MVAVKFWLMARIVSLPMYRASYSFDGSSERMVMAADSAAMSVLFPPRLTPMSAKARAGASLMPSPTIMTLPRFCIFMT